MCAMELIRRESTTTRQKIITIPQGNLLENKPPKRLEVKIMSNTRLRTANVTCFLSYLEATFKMDCIRKQSRRALSRRRNRRKERRNRKGSWEES